MLAPNESLARWNLLFQRFVQSVTRHGPFSALGNDASCNQQQPAHDAYAPFCERGNRWGGAGCGDDVQPQRAYHRRAGAEAACRADVTT